MPRLHAQFRHGIEFEPIDVAPEDILEVVPDAYHKSCQRVAKRRRIENIANQYLRGRNPVILSASLKGPFNTDWKNPWTDAPSKGDDAPAQAAGLGETNRQIDSVMDLYTQEQARFLPSPETSRAMNNGSKLTESVEEQQDLIGALASSSRPQHDDSEATKLFSVDANPPSTLDNSGINPHWLRRHMSVEIDHGQFRSGIADPSPTHSRSGTRPIGENGRLQLVPQNVPLVLSRSSPQRHALDTARISSALQFTVLPTPTQATRDTQTESPLAPKSNRHLPITSMKCTANKGPVNAAQNAIATQSLTLSLANEFPHATSTANQHAPHPQHAQVKSVSMSAIVPNGKVSSTRHSGVTASIEGPSAVTPINGACTSRPSLTSSSILQISEADPEVLEGHRSAKRLRLLAIEQAERLARSSRKPSRETIRESAERCADTVTDPGDRPKRKATKRKISKKIDSTPAPASSIGFTYKKVAEAKSRSKGTRNLKPPPGNADLPSATKCLLQVKPVAGEDEPTTCEGKRLDRPDIYEVPIASPTMAEYHESLRTSRNSGYSTQAAMMLAQLEFQEGTLRPSASESPGSLQHLHDGTPLQCVEQPSISFTPFSTFNAKLDMEHPPDSVSGDLPVSTQDLFTAASPFAFSTMKKKPAKIQGSGLRFTVFPGRHQRGHDERSIEPKSPTPRERTPLKARNSKVGFGNTVSEKGSQESILSESMLPRQDVELPRLEFPGTLDFGSHVGLDFSDRFLHNLGNMT